MSPLAVSGAYSRANALSRQQYHQPLPVLAKVDPIARAKINPVLINAGTNTFHVREITLLRPMDGCRHLDRRLHSDDRTIWHKDCYPQRRGIL